MLIATSIATKLIPLMFLPLFFGYFLKYKKKTVLAKETDKSLKEDALTLTPCAHLDDTPNISIENKKSHTNVALKLSRSVFSGLPKLIAFYSIIATTILLLFAPFFTSAFIDNYYKTIGLWFGDFEFNASIYYIARAVGYWFRGWNEIAIIGKILPVCVLLFVLYLSFFNKNKTTKQLIISMLFAFTFYLFMSTTVHPWYLATLVFLSVFTHYKFPLIWSFIIVISYFAYANTNHSENLWIISIEYIVVYGYFIWDVFIKHKTTKKK
uniref:hypothetical protein n=1 Tax=Lacinutrix neustonica TaxID=2980107 RepID=UPI0028BDBD23|nr:hypothetical protein [Lacinutrix neustonica]